MLNVMPASQIINDISVLLPPVLVVVFLLLYLSEKRQRNKLLNNITQSSLDKKNEKGDNILRRAYQKAQTILGGAELERVKMVADSRVEVRQLEDKYEGELEKLNADMEKSLSQRVTKAEEEFTKFLDDLRTRSEQMQLLSQEFTKQRVNEIFERFEQNLSSFLTSTEQKSVTAIELELRAARELVNTYKTQQMALIDENIIAMLEKTLSLVLAKKLTLKDHVDLVYEALEKAKAEKFIA